MGRHEKEVWKTIDIDGIKSNYYEISSWGNLRNKNGKKMKYDVDKDGYARYTLTKTNGKKKHFFAHRLVAMYFIPNPDNRPEVNHLNPQNKLNLYYKNFEWVTKAENTAHAVENHLQLTLSCSAHGMATLSNEDVHKVCKMMEDGYTNKDIINAFGIEGKEKREKFRGVLKHIRAHKTWKPISSHYNF